MFTVQARKVRGLKSKGWKVVIITPISIALRKNGVTVWVTPEGKLRKPSKAA